MLAAEAADRTSQRNVLYQRFDHARRLEFSLFFFEKQVQFFLLL